jgi:hypothetical protein
MSGSPLRIAHATLTVLRPSLGAAAVESLWLKVHPQYQRTRVHLTVRAGTGGSAWCLQHQLALLRQQPTSLAPASCVRTTHHCCGHTQWKLSSTAGLTLPAPQPHPGVVLDW